MIISEEFLKDRKQRVVLNGQCLSCPDIHTGVVPQGSILGPLLFFVYINDLSNDVKSKCKLFADDTSLFPVVHDILQQILIMIYRKLMNGFFGWKWS